MSVTFPLAPSPSSPLSSTSRVGLVSSLALSFFFSFFFFFFFQRDATTTLSSLAFSITFCAHGFGEDATGERFD